MDDKARKDACWAEIQEVLKKHGVVMSIGYETKIDPNSIQITLRTTDEANKN